MVIVLPAAAALIIAVVAILIILGAPAFKQLFNATVGKLPLVGGYISDIMTAALDAATSTLVNWAQHAGSAIADGVAGFVGHLWSIDSYATDAIGALVGAAGRLSTRLWNTAAGMDAKLNAATSILSNWINYWVATLRSEAAAMEARIDGAVMWWVGQLQGAISAAVATAQNLFTRAESDAAAAANAAQSAAIGAATGLFAQAESHINSVANTTMGAITALGGELTTEIAGAEQHAIDVAGALASQAATGAVDALDSAAHDLVLGPWEALIPQVEAIVGNLPADVAQAIPGLEALPIELPLTVPAILGALAPAIAVTTTEVARCLAPNCNPLQAFSNLFRGLEDAAFLAALVALLAEAHTNPGGLAHQVESDLSAITHGVAGEFRHLVGA